MRFEDSTILIVDDSSNDHFLMKRWLKKKGLTDIRYSSSGEAALKAINEMTKKPDLILLDLDLREEGLNGIDVLHELRSRRVTKDIKIVVVSGNMELLALAHEADLAFQKISYSSLMGNIDDALALLQ